MADPQLDPQIQSAIAAAQAAIARATQASQEADVFVAQAENEYAGIEASRISSQQELADEAAKIVQQMDEDTLAFLGDISA